MPSSYRPYQPEQSFLLPPSPRDWLPDNHLSLFISDVVEEMDLGEFEGEYEAGDPRGNQPFHPAMMLKILLYAYATGTFSSRKIAKKIEEDIAYRVLAGGNFPQHRTLCDFRKKHLQRFHGVFVQVVRIARAAGLVRLGRVAVDGTKVKANASRHKAMSYERMKSEEQRLEREIAELLKEAERTDRKEDAKLGEAVRGDELPEELRRRETRLAKIREAKKRLEERKAEEDRAKGRHEDDGGRPSGKKGRSFQQPFGTPDEKAQDNFTDPESRIMKMGNGFEQSYNGQVVVDESHQIIIATSLTNSPTDSQQLVPMIEQTIQITEAKPAQALADAGYRSERNFQCLEAMNVEVIVAIGREGKPSRAKVNATLPATRRVQERWNSPDGSSSYRRRKAIVEPIFGWIKNVLGFRQFSLRGVANVRGEWALVCLAMNVRRMSSLCLS